MTTTTTTAPVNNNVHLMDYSDSIRQAMVDFPHYKALLQWDVPLRQYMWDIYSNIVGLHIAEYTVPQYGDYPNDNVAKWSVQDCIRQIQKYANRLESNARGPEEMLRDLLKISHYCQLAFFKEKSYEELFNPELYAQDEVEEELSAEAMSDVDAESVED